MHLNELKDKFNLSDRQVNQFDTYAKFLVEYNEKINLTAITEYEDIIEKHFYDSLIPTIYKDIKGSLVDVGTGAGFPGVVIKILKPDLKVILVEPLGKRCIFLKELINKLELKDIEVINIRGEDFSKQNREVYDFVTARAVSNLPMLIEVCGALVKKDGYFIALRGKDGIEELNDSSYAINQMGFEKEEIHEDYLSDESKRVCCYLKKINKTPQKFPRQYSIIKKDPLCKK